MDLLLSAFRGLVGVAAVGDVEGDDEARPRIRICGFFVERSSSFAAGAVDAISCKIIWQFK